LSNSQQKERKTEHRAKQLILEKYVMLAPSQPICCESLPPQQISWAKRNKLWVAHYWDTHRCFKTRAWETVPTLNQSPIHRLSALELLRQMYQRSKSHDLSLSQQLNMTGEIKFSLVKKDQKLSSVTLYNTGALIYINSCLTNAQIIMS